jgi:hypothetical protein
VVNEEQLSSPLIKRAIAALNAGDQAAWLALFTRMRNYRNPKSIFKGKEVLCMSDNSIQSSE